MLLVDHAGVGAWAGGCAFVASAPLDQAELLEDVPMAVSPLTGIRSGNLEGGGR